MTGGLGAARRDIGPTVTAAPGIFLVFIPIP